MTATILEHETIVQQDAVPAGFIETTAESNDAAHIVKIPADKKGLTTPQALVLEARVFGTPVEALCGFTWVPSKDPQKYPVCEECLLIYGLTVNPEDRDKGLPSE